MPHELFDIEDFLRSADWRTLFRLRGSAHNTIIGFLSSRWLSCSPDHNFVLDGTPSLHVGLKGLKRRYADLLFCKDKLPLIVVEVESTVAKYEDKLTTLYMYLDNTEDFSGLQFGMLVLLNYTGRKDSYQHHWDKLKTMVRKRTNNIVLVSLKKRSEPPPFNTETHRRLMADRGYYHWIHQSIDFWIHFHNHEERAGNLWTA